MSYMASRRVSFSPDFYDDHPTTTLKHGSENRLAGNTKRVAGVFGFKLPRDSEFSAGNIISNIGTKVSRVLCFVTKIRKSSRKVSSDTLARSKSLADPERAQAIEDCIQFLNSSSTLHRSNSVSSNFA